MPRREVRISTRAARDLENIWQWHCDAGSREAAHRLIKSLALAIRNLPFTPLGSPVNPDTGARERAVGSHVIAYDVEPVDGVGPRAGNVNVLAIFGLGCAQGGVAGSGKGPAAHA
jgi:plasmid stabilization system protein ParE